MTIPSLLNKGVHSDIFSMALADFIIFLNGEINDQTAAIIIAQIICLNAKDPDREITLYINSPGGSVSAGLAIFDAIQSIRNDVATVGMGICASMAAVLLSGGAPGKRHVTRNCRVMIHQPLGGAHGKYDEVINSVEELTRMKALLDKILAENCGVSVEKIRTDTTKDHYMSAQEALAYGLIDKII